MERVITPVVNDYSVCIKPTNQREHFLHLYEALPVYGSARYWEALTAEKMPLEVLVHSVRHCEDVQGRNRLLECILCRIQSSNERWAAAVLEHAGVTDGEREELLQDLCADLYELLLRALLDPQRHYWEEHFQQCLYFARKHIFTSFMQREGHWRNLRFRHPKRIPRTLLNHLEGMYHTGREREVLTIEDEEARHLLDQVTEGREVLALVMRLPERLKTVILLLFWAGLTEKAVAQALHITDRTVRNRVAKALQLLRDQLDQEEDALL